MANIVFRIFSEKLGAVTASQFVGNSGEIFYDPDALSLRISDGVSPGGRLLVGSGAAGTVATDINVTPTGGIQSATVQAALQELDAEKLSKSGGIMTGELVLSNTAPVDAYAAVSKAFMETYVANTIASGGVVANNVVFNNANTTLTSNTIQGAVAELATTKLSLAGGALTGAVTTSQTIFANNELVTKSYVENLISTEDTYIDTIAFSTANGAMTFVNTDGTIINVSLNGRYLPLSGGTMTGELILSNTAPTSNNSAATVNYVSNYVNNAFANGSVQANTITFNNSSTTTISSNTIQGAIAELEAEKVGKAGDVMTGFLTLSADPTANLHATTKQYVDSKIANTNITSNNITYTPTGTLAANNVTAALTELDAEKVAKAGDTMAGYLTLYADPIAPLHAATKDYVDDKVAAGGGASLLDDLLDVNATVPLDGQSLIYDASLTRYILQNRVKNTGDTMTGALTLSGAPTANLHAATKAYVDTVATTAVAALIDSAPTTLDTLNELAAALGDDPNFATTVATNIAGKVAKAGDTMTGFLTLSADPTANLHATTKQYVDVKIANTTITANNISYTPTGDITANNVTAALTELDNEKVAKAGGVMTGALTLSGAPTANLHAATKAYVDTVATTVTLGGLTDVIDTVSNTATQTGSHLKWNGTQWAPGWTTVVQSIDTVFNNNFALLLKSATAAVSDILIDGNDAITYNPSTKTLTLDSNTITSAKIQTWDGITEKVAKSGDTMTGFLNLSGAPTANLHAATKLYVDSKTYVINDLTDVDTTGLANGQVLSWNGTNFIPFSLPAGTTDTYTANSTINANGVVTFTKSDNSTYTLDISTAAVLVGGDTMTGLLTLSGAPTANLHAATKAYVDAVLPDGVADGQELYWDGTEWTPQLATALSLHGYTSDALAEAAMIATGTPMGGGRVYWNTTDSKFRLYNGTVWSDVTSAGDVVGPASATDNAIARFDTTTGKLIQSSLATINDTGSLVANSAFLSSNLVVSGAYKSGFATSTGVLDWSARSYYKMTASSAITVSFTNVDAVSVNSMTVEIAMSGGSITWPTAVKWAAGTAPTLTNSKTHLVMLSTSNGGTTILASALTDFVP